MAGKFQELMDKLDQQTVDRWWSEAENASIPDGAKEWKYRYRKNGKELPVKYVVEALAKEIGDQLPKGSRISDR